MTIPMSQEQRNHNAAAISESHVQTISELGFTVHQERDANGCFGKAALDAPRREYTLADGTKIFGPIPGDLPAPELRKHFVAELERANRVVEHGVFAKMVPIILTGALTAGLVVMPKERRVPVDLQVTKNRPVTTPDQPHGHSETAGAVLLVGRAAEGMYANVTATATTTTYTLPKL